MVILHPRAGCWSDMDATRFPIRPCEGSIPLKMPTNGLLRAAGLETKCGAQSEQVLPTQLSPVGKKKKTLEIKYSLINKVYLKLAASQNLE